MTILTFDGHHESEHFVVSASRKHDVSCEQLVQTHGHRPQIDGTIICEVFQEVCNVRCTAHMMKEGVMFDAEEMKRQDRIEQNGVCGLGSDCPDCPLYSEKRQ